ncbi:F-box protein [Golovinomyces cichoracearum]|uniref:F-box protein n=1 Tax=Golovinomyces cichoracearum TaxID=62708 RepID=A0A420IAW4_9PEZI|nr:F-box protein [Golovinomyces cichoracearum]
MSDSSIPALPNSRFSSNDSLELEGSTTLIPKHPSGIRPLGNQFLTTINVKISAGYFRKFPEVLLVTLLEFLNPITLLKLGSTCKYLHAFCRLDSLWRTLYTRSQNSNETNSTWLGTWRSKYLNLKNGVESIINCNYVFSDILYRPFLCSQLPLQAYASNIPEANSISRLKDISLSEFTDKWGHKPFILTNQMQDWPVYKYWDNEFLLKQYHHVKFRAEGLKWRLDEYFEYMKNNCDESPLYLFDKDFFEKMDLKSGESKFSSSYWSPECFEEDFFTVLGKQRPDFRWLIVGPERSGSSFHKDPNATSAWNAVLRGSKYWIMFPTTNSRPSPPGVYVSKDESEVTSPLSIAEWLLGFHAEARRTPGCIEGICREGEILHVPSGWWHLVVNLETTTAITQNFVPRIHLAKVLRFLEHKSDQISGFKKDLKSPFRTFTDKMLALHPDLMRQALNDSRESLFKKRKLVPEFDEKDKAGGFTFSFFGDNEEELL